MEMSSLKDMDLPKISGWRGFLVYVSGSCMRITLAVYRGSGDFRWCGNFREKGCQILGFRKGFRVEDLLPFRVLSRNESVWLKTLSQARGPRLQSPLLYVPSTGCLYASLCIEYRGT